MLGLKLIHVSKEATRPVKVSRLPHARGVCNAIRDFCNKKILTDRKTDRRGSTRCPFYGVASDEVIWNSCRMRKLRVVHAPGMPGTFYPPPRVSDTDMHHGTWVTHVPWCIPGSLASGFPWSQWRGKRPRHSRRMRNPQFYVSVRGPC